MDLENQEFKETKEQKQEAVIRKDNLVTTFKSLVTFLVKQFNFDCIPMDQKIHHHDPSTNLKNQIKYYCTWIFNNMQKNLGVQSESEAFQLLIDWSTTNPDLRKYTEELVNPILNVNGQDISIQFDKEFTIKKGKPPYFDPDFNGTINQEFNDNYIIITIEWVTVKEKLYPVGIISSVRKFLRMLFKTQKIFQLMYASDPRYVQIQARVNFQYSKNQINNEVYDVVIYKDKLSLEINFLKQSISKFELGLM